MPASAATEATQTETTYRRTNTSLKALGLAWLTTLIWASSFILIKMGLKDVQPLGFAAIRYSLGGLMLLAYLPTAGLKLPRLTTSMWGLIALAGVLAYTVGQGLFYIGQAQVSALTGAFFYSLSPLFVLLLQAVHQHFRPTAWQLLGVGAVLVGALIFYPLQVASGQWLGIALLVGSNVSTAYYLLLTRSLRISTHIHPVWLTSVILLVGGGLLFVPALLFERPPHLGSDAFIIIAWLAALNTAFAYTVWNYLLKLLSALELSVMSSLIPLQTGLIGWLIFGDALSLPQIAGLLIAIAGVFAVQSRALFARPANSLRQSR